VLARVRSTIAIVVNGFPMVSVVKVDSSDTKASIDRLLAPIKLMKQSHFTQIPVIAAIKAAPVGNSFVVFSFTL
jgi:hypothetical protein